MAALRSQFLHMLLLIALLCPFCHAVPATNCSTTCESMDCTNARFRYGKYCGIFYTGCPGEAPCDGLDKCCMTHDNCVGNSNYLSTSCNQALLDCIRTYQNSGEGQFPGNTCNVRDVENTITIVVEAGVLIGEAIGDTSCIQHVSHLPPI